MTGRRDLATVDGWIAEWPVVIEAVARANKGLAGVLRDCKPLEADATTLTIGTQGRFHLEQISDPDKRAVIAGAVSAIGGRPLEIVTRFTGEERPRGEVSGTVSDITQAVLDTFAGSRSRRRGCTTTPGSVRRDRSTVRRLPSRGTR